MHSLWGSWRGFRYISPKLNGSGGWNLEYKWGVMMSTHTKNRGNRPRGSITWGCQNMFCFFSANNTTRTFGHLSWADFDHFRKKRRESVCACVLNRWKFSEFLRWGFTGPKKQLKWVLSRGVCDRGIQLRRHGTIVQLSMPSSLLPFTVQRHRIRIVLFSSFFVELRQPVRPYMCALAL